MPKNIALINSLSLYLSLCTHRRHSDDPLISGAIDDNQNEFKALTLPSLIATTTPSSPPQQPATSIAASSQQQTTTSAAASRSTNTTTAARKKVSRTRRKGQFKLRFHHQALPQEYLDHYEATQNNLQRKEAEQIKANKAAAAASSSMEVNDHLQAARTHASVRNWLQKISEFQNETATAVAAAAAANSKVPPAAQVGSTTHQLHQQMPPHHHSQPQAIIRLDGTNRMLAAEVLAGTKKPSASRVVSYNDLPYMGEMTLDNSKPRRGRKPKKADICHLIYKNYGTILPGTPKDMMENNEKIIIDITADKPHPMLAPAQLPAVSKVNSSRSSGSLLEKRLTNEEIDDDDDEMMTECANVAITTKLLSSGEQPLNLCVRDRSVDDTLTLSSGDEDEVDSCFAPESNRTTPSVAVATPSTASPSDAFFAANLKMSLPNFQTAMLPEKCVLIQPPKESPATAAQQAVDASPNQQQPGYVYWPGAGVFIHPISLYYQKMVDSGVVVPTGGIDSTITLPTTSTTTASSNPSTAGHSTPAVSPMPPSPSPASSPREPIAKILIPKNIAQLLKQENLHSSPPPEQLSKSSASTTTPTPPQKRKRSAIFIPPMPVESSSSHATEVSICKFKFTGGAKPSLQEKKMLSVDSGGNFRYYSGTGDKSMRGYEFFPRESLQQSNLLSGGTSAAGAFLNTPGEKISIDLPPPSLGLSNEVLQIPGDLPSPGGSSGNGSGVGGMMLGNNGIPTVVSLLPAAAAGPIHSVGSGGGPTMSSSTLPNGGDEAAQSPTDRRKRKSRRSLQREKLEKTFKEKGFLIQTQQLESAEGATYCKFRQLRKFTRYLFRSWKDYLPGDLQQQQQQLQQLHGHPEMVTTTNNDVARISGGSGVGVMPHLNLHQSPSDVSNAPGGAAIINNRQS